MSASDPCHPATLIMCISPCGMTESWEFVTGPDQNNKVWIVGNPFALALSRCQASGILQTFPGVYPFVNECNEGKHLKIPAWVFIFSQFSMVHWVLEWLIMWWPGLTPDEKQNVFGSHCSTHRPWIPMRNLRLSIRVAFYLRCCHPPDLMWHDKKSGRHPVSRQLCWPVILLWLIILRNDFIQNICAGLLMGWSYWSRKCSDIWIDSPICSEHC